MTEFTKDDNRLEEIKEMNSKENLDVEEPPMTRQETQEQLSQKLEEFRRKSRSVNADHLNRRPRAKSEEVTFYSVPPRRKKSEPRSRLRSDPNESELNAPELIRKLSRDSDGKRLKRKTSLPPPPMQFRDPPPSDNLKMGLEAKFATYNARREKLMSGKRSQTIAEDINNHLSSTLGRQPSSLSRQQTFDKDMSSSLSRIELKNNAFSPKSQRNDVMVVERTGDCLETKPLENVNKKR